MSSSVIYSVGAVGVLAAGAIWVVTPPLTLGAPSWSGQYALNDSGAQAESGMTAEQMRDLEVERLLTPPALPGFDLDVTATPGKLPKASIRDPFYDYGPAFLLEAQAKVAADETASNESTAKPAPVKRVALPKQQKGYGKSTVSAAWRKLENMRRSVLFAGRSDRTTTSRFSGGDRKSFRSSRWSSALDDQ